MGSTERLIPYTISSFRGCFLFAMHRCNTLPLAALFLSLPRFAASPNIIAKLLAIDFHLRPAGDDGTGRFYNLLFAQRDRHNITWHDRAKMGPQKFGIGRQQCNGGRSRPRKGLKKKLGSKLPAFTSWGQRVAEGRIYKTY